MRRIFTITVEGLDLTFHNGSLYSVRPSTELGLLGKEALAAIRPFRLRTELTCYERQLVDGLKTINPEQFGDSTLGPAVNEPGSSLVAAKRSVADLRRRELQVDVAAVAGAAAVTTGAVFGLIGLFNWAPWAEGPADPTPAEVGPLTELSEQVSDFFTILMQMVGFLAGFGVLGALIFLPWMLVIDRLTEGWGAKRIEGKVDLSPLRGATKLAAGYEAGHITWATIENAQRAHDLRAQMVELDVLGEQISATASDRDDLLGAPEALDAKKQTLTAEITAIDQHVNDAIADAADQEKTRRRSVAAQVNETREGDRVRALYTAVLKSTAP